jgi:DNA-binding CsgD family transcriptional regulator
MELAWQAIGGQNEIGAIFTWQRIEAKLAIGDVEAARGWANEGVQMARGWHRMMSLIGRARVTLATDDLEAAEADVHQALSIASESAIRLGLPEALECLGQLSAKAESHQEAARLYGAASGIRRDMGAVRFKIHDAVVDEVIQLLREALGENGFQAHWAEGAALSVEEAIAYARRGRGERRRPSSGWASLTPAERDVVRLVGEGLGNKEIGARLFVSPRTVQTHLTHVYAKVGLTSRVQLAQEAARRAQDAL